MRPSPQCGPRLDDATASRKLVIAAALHGAKTSARYAIDFASHGMVEVRSIHLLKGPSVREPKRLDEVCSLIPYREALRRASSFLPADMFRSFPNDLGGVCALDVTDFAHPTANPDFDNEYFGSPLLKNGIEAFALCTGLVWGAGLRVIQNWRATPVAAKAVLPFWLLSGPGRTTFPVELLPKDFPRMSKQRPLPRGELFQLMAKLHELPHESRPRLNVALRRLRNASEYRDEDDVVIDLCIALEALFMQEGEWRNQRKVIAKRGSWYFADSVQERQCVRTALKEFYKIRSRIVHGNPATPRSTDDITRRNHLIAVAFDVARASLKSMIVQGRPTDWSESMHHSSIRHTPPRDSSQIPSVKSDSLSWTVEEQNEIDRALESVWRPSVEQAPSPSTDTKFTIHRGIRSDKIEKLRREGKHCLVRHPAVLYMAHPKWPKTDSDPLDERTEFYCERDVARHMLRWREAASDKRLDQVEFPADDAFLFHPKRRRSWPQPLR